MKFLQAFFLLQIKFVVAQQQSLSDSLTEKRSQQISKVEKYVRKMQSKRLGNQAKVKIIGGDPANITEYSNFMCHLVDESKSPVCGCTIIAPNVALSAAHCAFNDNNVLQNVEDWYVEVNKYYTDFDDEQNIDPVRLPLEEYLIPNEYDNSNIEAGWDAMLLKTVGMWQGPIITLKFTPTNWTEEDEFTIAGWGDTDHSDGVTIPGRLNDAELNYLDPDECKEEFGVEEHPTQICAYKQNKSPCTGDFGGPLLFRNAHATGRKGRKSKPNLRHYLCGKKGITEEDAPIFCGPEPTFTQVGISSFVGPDGCSKDAKSVFTEIANPGVRQFINKGVCGKKGKKGTLPGASQLNCNPVGIMMNII